MHRPASAGLFCVTISKIFVCWRSFPRNIISTRGDEGTCSIPHLPSSILHLLWLCGLPRRVQVGTNWSASILTAAARLMKSRRSNTVVMP